MFTQIFGRFLKGSENAPPQNFLEDSNNNGIITSSPWLIPHDEKKAKGGEDTYFISSDGYAIGVFDGVGGWADVCDPRMYSYKLMEGCKKYSDTTTDSSLRTPLHILNYGWEYANLVTGSSTACVALFSPETSPIAVPKMRLDVLNVGDSGLMVVQNDSGEIVLKTKEQQHRFNCPYQLGSGSGDMPSHGNTYSLIVTNGHTIIFGTDGLYDNLFPEQISQIVREHLRQPPQDLARVIANTAYTTSLMKDAKTPFGEQCLKKYGQKHGGKPDDITVLVVKFNQDFIPDAKL
eukprot:TRINITY_DN2563_c0_g1_i3.p1 TRINITY_DN2563_c0_g1~~TRINITY_DN2563_c0_g1_i3.p1  ORF type:complete len:291 (-),score=65.01 TRINITY_DN2563_c0_g1_i3:72-944(-)